MTEFVLEALIKNGAPFKLVGQVPTNQTEFADTVEFTTSENAVWSDISALANQLEADAVKQRVTNNVVQFANTIRQTITGHASPEKMAGWTAKVERANRILAGTATQADLTIIGTEAQIKGDTIADLAGRIATKASEFGSASAAVEAIEDRVLEVVELADTPTRLTIEGMINQERDTLELQTRETIGAWLQAFTVQVTQMLTA